MPDIDEVPDHFLKVTDQRDLFKDEQNPHGGCGEYRLGTARQPQSGSANDVKLVPDGISTCCLPSSMCVMAAVPQMDHPVG